MGRIFSGRDDYSPVRAGVAGAAGALAYLVEMRVDLAALRCPTNDLMLLGRPFSANRRAWPAIGTALHFFNGVALAQVYALLGRRLPGPPWLRGLLFTQIENTLLYSVVPLFDRFHPAITAGELPRMFRPVPFVQQVLRHIAYGVVLGAVYGEGRRRHSARGERGRHAEPA